MNINLSGKKAIISGSTTGIGYAVARGLAIAEAEVLINGRDEKRIQEAVARLKREVPNAVVSGMAADLSQPEGANAIISRWPEADILVNNLGLYQPKNFFEITDEDWDYYFQVNVMSAVRLSRHYAKKMVKNQWGRITFNASVTGGFFQGEMVHYGATKAALFGLSRGLAESVAGTGVTVNAFIPGPTKSENAVAQIQEVANKVGKTFNQVESELFHSGLPTSLIQRFSTPEEIANLVVFLSSEQASAITGAALHVDGGIIRNIL